MSDSILPSGTVAEQEVRFSLIPGEVVGVDRQTDTHFETTSGSVVAFGNVVSVTAPSVTASSTASKRVWVRRKDGTELSIAAPDSVQARAGHKVAVMLASGMQAGVPKHQWCAIVNYTTGHWNQVDRHPPVHVYNAWTNFWAVNVKQGGPVLAFFFILVLWVAIWLMRWTLFGTNDMLAFITNFWMAIAVGVGSLWWMAGQSKAAEHSYAKVLRRAADAAFEAGYPEPVPVATGAASG